MGNLSEHFDTAEFACKCNCGFGLGDDDVSSELVEALEDCRAYFGGHPVVINSGCRCKRHNANVGGASSSQHILGTAADFVVSRQSPKAVADYLERKWHSKYGIGRYSTWTHLDVRRNKARWGSN